MQLTGILSSKVHQILPVMIYTCNQTMYKECILFQANTLLQFFETKNISNNSRLGELHTSIRLENKGLIPDN